MDVLWHPTANDQMGCVTPLPTPSALSIVRACFLSFFSRQLPQFNSFYATSSSDSVLVLPKSGMALGIILKSLAEHGPIHVHIPELFCVDTLELMQIEEYGYSFYRLTETLYPDLEDLSARIVEGPLNVVIAAHYFGEIFDFSNLSNLISDCTQNCILIEDAAHHIRGADFRGACVDREGLRTGQWGAITLYSPYKQLALPEGAACVLTDRLPAHYREVILEHYIRLKSHPTTTPWMWFVKRWVQAVFPAFRSSPIKPIAPHLLLSQPPAPRPLSSILTWLLFLFLETAPQFIQFKQAQLARYQTFLSRHFPTLSLFHFSAQAQPFRLILFSDDPQEFDRLKSIPTFSELFQWPDLPKPVLEELSYKVAHQFVSHVRFLPLHNRFSI